MLNKVRAKRGIDLPVEKWRRTPVLAFVIGALAILFIVVPIVAIVLRGLVEHPALTAIGIGGGVLALLATSLFVRV